MDAWSLFRQIGSKLGAFPGYAARTNMEYALYRAYGPNWEERMRQQQQDQEMGQALDRATLDNKRMDLDTKYWQSWKAQGEATNEMLDTALKTGGRTTGKYTPAMVGKPGSQKYEGLGELAFTEAERKRKEEAKAKRRLEIEKMKQGGAIDREEIARKRQRDIGELGIERYKTSPEYLDERYEDRTDYESREAAEERHTPPGQPAEKESVTERVARKLALANQILQENPDLDHTRQMDLTEDEPSGQSEYYLETGRPIPYKDWDTVPYNVQQEVEQRLNRNYELGKSDPAATPAPEQDNYRIPVSLRLKIDSGEDLTPDEIELLRRLRQGG